jgi:hypothetical protein
MRLVQRHDVLQNFPPATPSPSSAPQLHSAGWCVSAPSRML